MQVKPGSVWFQDAARLTHWQKLKKSGDAAMLAAYRDRMASRREAWRFIAPQTVKILGHQPAKNRVRVKMESAGRMQGTIWLLDASALTP